MKKNTAALFIFLLSPFLSYCQTVDKAANEAYVLTRMVNRFHIDPRPVDKTFSAYVFNGMLKRVDDDRIYFTATDISRLSVYRTALDEEIKHRKTAYLSLFINIYQRRLKIADSLIGVIAKTPFNFYTPEKFTVAEDTSYPQPTMAAMKLKLYKRLKASTLDELTDDLPNDFKSLSPLKQKKFVDSDVAILQKKVVTSYKRKIDHILHSPYGITQDIGDDYCEVIAQCFDPHTEFFPPEEKENFESELGNQPFEFGFTIKVDKDGGFLINKLEPGSPAFKGGKLNKGDKFISIQWEGQQAVEVRDISVNEFSSLLDESNHTKALFTFKKVNGAVIQVSLTKERVAGDDDDKVKSFVLNGADKIGYIYLPAFYEDWESDNDGLNGCANDVGREILKLKKENISGLILDLRYNGGGSVREATELAGIFIDAGPVEQSMSKDEKVYTWKDVNRGTIYDGPLVILVNGASASASELVAGTLQNYNRAVIIGSPTYGKATAQVVFPMDTTVTVENIRNLQTKNYLKITVSKLFRVDGTTAQFSGVKPDIILPDILDAYITKEADEPLALRPTVINPNKYYTPYPQLPLNALAGGVQHEIDTNKYLNAVKNLITYSNQQKKARDISLNIKDALNNMDSSVAQEAIADAAGSPTKKYKVQNSRYDMARIQADSDLKDLNDEFTERIAGDAYISIAYDVLVRLKTQ